MAGSNSPFASSSVSSLLRSANSAANKIADYQDSLAAFEYQNSAHTDDAFKTYSDYLKGRIDGLKNGDLTAQQKALSLTKTLETAYHANTSANIQRANIAIMAGNGTLRDKYSLLSDQYGQAIANGDYTLAQSIESQAYSVSQQIQYQEQQAQTAANTLAEASARAGARSEAQLADSLKQKLQDFNFNYAHAGQKTADSLLGDFVKQNADTLSALGITLQQGVQPNYFDIVDGINRAIYKAYSLAGDAVAPFAEDGGQSYYDKASAVVTKIPTIYGDMSAQQLLDAASNPAQYSYNTAPDYVSARGGGVGGKQNPQVGYRIDQNGGVAPVISDSPWVDVPNSVNAKLQQLGLQVISKNTGSGLGFTVQATNQSPDWLKQILPKTTAGQATTVVVSGNPQLGTPGIQFEADAVNGQGKAVYTITTDQNGKNAVYESSNLGDTLLTSDPGYDKTFAPNARDYQQPKAHQSFFSRLGDAFNAVTSNFGSAFGGSGNSSTSALIQRAQAQQRQQQQDAAAAALLAKPTSLPPLNMATPPPIPPLAVSAPKPLPSLTVAKPTPLPVAPQTVSPQPAATLSVQGGSGPSLQGGGIRLQ